MQLSPVLEISLRKIEENSRRIVQKCSQHEIDVLGVTRGLSAQSRIVTAMLSGGIVRFADPQLDHIISLKKQNFDHSMTLLRTPSLSSVDKVLAYADYSVNSELAVIKALADKASQKGIKHNIILAIDVGELGAGILPEDAVDSVKEISRLSGITICGIGTTMGSYGGLLPTIQNLKVLLGVKEEIESKASIKLDIVSGGGTSSLQLLDYDMMPDGVDELRVGEGILLGTDTTHNYKIPWLHQDAFILRTEVIELKTKPSVPIGTIGRDAFGNKPVFEDKGFRKRAIVALGKQDVNIEGLFPLNEDFQILGGSSDHLIVDVTECAESISVGDQIAFRLNYQGILSSNNSKYIKKAYV